MDSTESEAKISGSECSVHCSCSCPSALRHGKAKILKVLQAASSGELGSLRCLVNHCFRIFCDIHTARSSSSEPLGCILCVWVNVMWTWTVYVHPDSHSCFMCQNHSGALLHFCDPDSRLHYQYRFFHGERRTVAC